MYFREQKLFREQFKTCDFKKLNRKLGFKLFCFATECFKSDFYLQIAGFEL